MVTLIQEIGILLLVLYSVHLWKNEPEYRYLVLSWVLFLPSIILPLRVDVGLVKFYAMGFVIYGFCNWISRKIVGELGLDMGAKSEEEFENDAI